MIRTLNSQRIMLIARQPVSLPFKLFSLSSNIPWYSRTLFKFSQQKKSRLPRNKQQMWMQQQQKNLKESAPQDELADKTYDNISKSSVIALSVLTMGLIFLFTYSYNKGTSNLVSLSNDISGLVQTKEEESLIGGDWTLINSEGQAFSSRNLQGSYYLIFFGYTKSPDISPSTLFYLSSVYRIIRNLPEGAYLKFKIVFVSLDPERDTPKVIKKYLDNFGKQIIGVTGSSPKDVELMECLRQFRIKFSRQAVKKGEPKDRYRIDHTSRVFLMDPDNKYIDYLDPNLTEQQTALAIMTKVAKNEHKKAKSVEKFTVS